MSVKCIVGAAVQGCCQAIWPHINNLGVDATRIGLFDTFEQHLIALHIPFMKMLALPKHGQNGVHGMVACVPTNIAKTSNFLLHSSLR